MGGSHVIGHQRGLENTCKASHKSESSRLTKFLVVFRFMNTEPRGAGVISLGRKLQQVDRGASMWIPAS